MLSKKKNIYQVMIFIELTKRFCARNLLFIPYSLFMFCSLDLNQHHSSDLKWKKKCKILRGFENVSVLFLGDFSCIPSPETTLVKFVVWFYTSLFFGVCSNILYITSLSSWVVRVVDCRFEGCRFKSLQNCLCDSCMFAWCCSLD